MKILIVDNFDSFTHNLFHIVEEFCNNVIVKRNNELNQLNINNFDKIILSPGPGLPIHSGEMKQLISDYSINKSILGICLGHQALADSYGLKLFNLRNVKHGVQSTLTYFDNDDYIFSGIFSPIEVGHYHSWVINSKNNFENWNIIAKTNNMIMGISHKKLDLKGLQFHPESILTPFGKKMIQNWINY